jgi:uncharacterized RDD family membrane protein YckC
MTWYYVVGGQSVGPVSEVELDALAQNGTIRPETLVWRDGMAAWEPYSSIKAPAAAAAPVAGGLRVASPAADPASSGSAAADLAACSQCGTVLPRTDLVQIGNNLVCAACKPAYVQKLREGVPVDGLGAVEYGGFWIRFGAAFLDGIIMNVVNMMLGFAFGMSMGRMMSRSADASVGLTVLSLAIPLAYDIIMVGTWGATLGKMACKLRIVTADGGKVSYARALARYFSKVLSFLTCLIGFIIAAFDDQKRALHDRICNTRVIKIG